MHEMILTITDKGTETWECLYCPRKFQITSWNPFTREILSDGDSTIRHFGNKGDISIGSIEIE